MKTITHPDGSQVLVKLLDIDALDCWEIQRGYVDFCMTDDPKFRREFTMAVLQYAVVVLDEIELPLKTDALVNNHLRTWNNLKEVFEGVLIKNGIDPETHAQKPNYWQNAGAEMAVSFIAEASKLMAPAIAMVSKKAED